MLICHKRVASNEAAVLQECHVSDVHATMHLKVEMLNAANWPNRQCLACQRRDRLLPLKRTSTFPCFIFDNMFPESHCSVAVNNFACLH